MIAIVNYNVLECEAYLTVPQLTNAYLNVQKDLLELQQAELNLMNDSQKVYDLLNQYLAGRIDKSAVEAAQAELLRSKTDWHKKTMQYLADTANFEPASNYPYGPASLYPDGALPNSAYPNGVLPSSAYPNGVYLPGAAPITNDPYYNPAQLSDTDTTVVQVTTT